MVSKGYKQKMEKACNALKPLGYPKTKVRAKLKELLKLYDNKWELIEDDEYMVLVEAMLEKSDDAQRGKSKNKISAGYGSHASEPQTKKLCTKYKNRNASSAHYSNASSVRISSENKEGAVISLSSGPNTHSEPGEFETPRKGARLGEKRKIEASVTDSGKQLALTVYQVKDETPSWFFENASESEEFEIPLKRASSKRSKGLLNEAEFPHTCNEETAESIQLHVGDEQISMESASLSEHATYVRKKATSSQTCSTVDKIGSSHQYIDYKNVKSPISQYDAPKTSMVCYASPKVVPCMLADPSSNELDLHHGSYGASTERAFSADQQEQNPQTVVLDIPFLECEDSGYSNKNDSHAKADDSNLMGTRSTGVADTDLSRQLCKVSYAHKSNAIANADKLKLMDPKPPHMEDKGDCFLKSKFDVASSPKGEVKLCLICNASQQSDFCVSSFDKVVKVVEGECRKSYCIKEPEFSLRKLMRELCERLLEMGANSSADEQIIPSVQDKPSKVHDATEFPGSTDASQLDFLIPRGYFNGSVIFRNLIKVGHQISRPITLDGLDFLHGVIEFKMEHIKNICLSGGKKLKVLESSQAKSSSSGAGQKRHLLLNVVKPYAYLDDITRGEENVKISFVRGSSPEDLTAFDYIAQNVVYDKAFVKFTLSSISDEDFCLLCTEDCLTSAIPCACAQETGGEFAYTSTGLVKERFLKECTSSDEDPNKHCYVSCMSCPVERSKNIVSSCCKGHSTRMFIKECWSRCGCRKKCGNRVVQRGITRNLQVFWTPEGKGWGLRTVERLPRGAFVCEYAGEIVTFSELCERNMRNINYQNWHPVPLDAAWGSENILKDEEALCLDATNYGNIARFINHRCFDANLVQIPVEVETTNHHYYHVALFTKREVAAMEELTWDYGIDFIDANYPVKTFKCLCESPVCRDPNH